MNGFIMAAGLGTRLAPFTEELPKPLFPAGSRTFLDRNAEFLKNSRATTVVVNLHHLGAKVREHADRENGWGLNLVFSEEPQILGTGGGARRAAELLDPGPLMIVAGDIAANLDPEALLAAHRAARQSSGAQATIVLAERGDVNVYGGVRVRSDGAVIDLAGILSRREGRLLVNASIHILEEELIPALPGPGGCLVRDFYIPLIEKGIRLNGHIHDGFWAEGGTPELLLDLNRELLDLESPKPRFENDTVKVNDPVAIGCEVSFGRNVVIGPQVVIADGCSLGHGSQVSRSVLLPGAIVHPGEIVTETVRSARHEWKRPSQRDGL